MGQKKKYTQAELLAAVEKYFATITRMVPATEKIQTGVTDSYGHMTYESRNIKNSLGEEVQLMEYIEPPSVANMCIFLGISTTTWENYSKDRKTGKKPPAAQYAWDMMLAYLQKESLTRQGKDLRGVEFNLEFNYGMGKRRREDDGADSLDKLDGLLKEFKDAVKPKAD